MQLKCSFSVKNKVFDSNSSDSKWNLAQVSHFYNNNRESFLLVFTRLVDVMPTETEKLVLTIKISFWSIHVANLQLRSLNLVTYENLVPRYF